MGWDVNPTKHLTIQLKKKVQAEKSRCLVWLVFVRLKQISIIGFFVVLFKTALTQANNAPLICANKIYLLVIAIPKSEPLKAAITMLTRPSCENIRSGTCLKLKQLPT